MIVIHQDDGRQSYWRGRVDGATCIECENDQELAITLGALKNEGMVNELPTPDLISKMISIKKQLTPQDITTLSELGDVMQTIWRAEPESIEQTCAVIAIPKTREQSQYIFSLDDEVSGLCITSGSIIATIIVGTALVAGPSITLLLRSHSRITESIVDDFRLRSLGKLEHLRKTLESKLENGDFQENEVFVSAKIEWLKGIKNNELVDLTKLVPDTLPADKPTIILVHGLLSTDVGTFDDLIVRLRMHFGNDKFTFIGFPHDTLEKIHKNSGNSLARYIRERIGLDGPNLIFICHSRGGLVARSASIHLVDRREDGEKWRKKLLGCITFGTPHLGTVAAEQFALLAGFLVAGKNLSTRGINILPIVDSLCLLSRQNSIKTIEDLKKKSNFITDDLQNNESRLALNKSPFILDIFAVGGQVGETHYDFSALKKNWKEYLKIDKFIKLVEGVSSAIFLNTAKHDLVVEADSSMPKELEILNKVVMAYWCTHGEYFLDEKINLYFNQITTFIKQKISS